MSRFFTPTMRRWFRLASGALMLAAMFQFADGTQAVGSGILRGYLDIKVPDLHHSILLVGDYDSIRLLPDNRKVIWSIRHVVSFGWRTYF